MNRTKRLIAAVAIVVGLGALAVACSPEQVQWNVCILKAGQDHEKVVACGPVPTIPTANNPPVSSESS